MKKVKLNDGLQVAVKEFKTELDYINPRDTESVISAFEQEIHLTRYFLMVIHFFQHVTTPEYCETHWHVFST